MSDDRYLDKVYDLPTIEETRALYDAWSGSYDSEIMENGYATPDRVARALAAQIRNLDAPILDYGCGTGLSGAALIAAGFTAIDGADLSADMLKGAMDKGVYRALWQVQPDGDLPFETGKYHAITATGVIGVGAAPPETFDLLMGALNPGGLLALSLNDHAMAEPAFTARLHDHIFKHQAKLMFEEYGEHLPGIDLKSTVYVLEKT
jgi:predicted TPR repeat methyltransferase